MTAYLYDSNGDYVGFVGVDMAAGEPEPVYPATMEAEFDALVPGEGLRMLLLYTIDQGEGRAGGAGAREG